MSGAGGGFVRVGVLGELQGTLAQRLGTWGSAGKAHFHSSEAEQAQPWLLRILLPWRYKRLL